MIQEALSEVLSAHHTLHCFCLLQRFYNQNLLKKTFNKNGFVPTP